MPNDYISQVEVDGTTYDIKDTSSGFITTETDPTVPSWAKAESKPTYTYSEVGALSAATVIPSAVTEATVSGWGFTKNAGTVTSVKMNGTILAPTSGVVDIGTVLSSYTETDPTVPSWAKASSKPTYTYSEVGALSSATSIPTEATVSGWGFTKNTGTVTGVKMNGTTLAPTSGVIDIGTVLSSYTETDPTVPSWAKASSKPTYTYSEVGAASSAHTHTSDDITDAQFGLDTDDGHLSIIWDNNTYNFYKSLQSAHIYGTSSNGYTANYSEVLYTLSDAIYTTGHADGATLKIASSNQATTFDEIAYVTNAFFTSQTTAKVEAISMTSDSVLHRYEINVDVTQQTVTVTRSDISGGGETVFRRWS